MSEECPIRRGLFWYGLSNTRKQADHALVRINWFERETTERAKNEQVREERSKNGKQRDIWLNEGAVECYYLNARCDASNIQCPTI